MKKRLINLLIAIILIATCACAFTACDDGGSGTPTPPTEEQWETAIAFNYNRFQYVVTSGEASIAYYIDGDIAYEKEQYVGRPTKETYLAKVGDNYFEYEKLETDVAWQRLPMSQADYTELMQEYKATEFKNMFDYESFTFDSGSSAFVAESIGMFTDVNVYFNNGKITKMTYATSDEWIIDFTYNDTALSVPTNIITVNFDAWNGAFNFTDIDYSYTLKVGEETTTVTVDGENVRHQKTIGDSSTITTAFKDGDSYYTLAPYTGWEKYAHPVYAWEDYYAKTTVTAQSVESLKNACANYLPSFAYSDFTFNSANNNFTATLIQIDDAEYSDVIVTFDDFNKLEKVEYVLIKDSNSTNVSIEFNFSDTTISKPDNIVTYVNPIPEEYESSFSLTADNYIGILEEYVMGYLKPNRIKIEKAGNKICLSEMTYNDDDFTKITYYDKDGNNYYKFAKVNDAWYKIRITEKAYNEIVNKMLNTVLIYNGDYAFEHLSQGPYAYSVSAGNGESVLTIFHVDYKVDRIVVGPFKMDADEYPEAQFFFDYGTASVTIPESQTAPYSIQIKEDWKTFFYRENYMDFTATIVSGDGKTSIYQSDYTNGTQTVYINVNAYSDSSKQYVQKTADGNYTYEYLMSNGNWYQQLSSEKYGSTSDIKMFESKLTYTFACPDFSDYFSYFTYNEDEGIFEFNGSQTSTMTVNGMLGYTRHKLKYASVKIGDNDKLETVVIETNDETPIKYTITFSEFGTTPSMKLPR